MLRVPLDLLPCGASNPLAHAFGTPALRKNREGRGAPHCLAGVGEIESLGHPLKKLQLASRGVCLSLPKAREPVSPPARDGSLPCDRSRSSIPVSSLDSRFQMSLNDSSGELLLENIEISQS
jgi:hypothetical protein